jgi:signal transduction histidine kinase
MEVQAAKDELLSLASHQLRTPATIVKQYLGVILQNYSGDITKAQREIIQTAYDSNERQLEIANQFLNAARFDSGRIELDNKDVTLNDILFDVVTEQRKIAKTRKQKIVFSDPKKRYKIKGDSKYLPMVFENLLSNAIKYSKQNTEINIRLHKAAGNVYVDIIDQGMGISEDEQLEVFEKFSRASSELNAGRNGTGIGLYLTKQIVDLHGGDIKIESVLGKGSKFTVILPLEEKD